MSTSQPQSVSISQRSSGGALAALRRLPRWSLIAGAIVLLAAGMFLKWDVLVAAGIAPLIVGLLPCAAMCALGMCAGRMGGKGKCSQSPSAPETPSSKTDAA